MIQHSPFTFALKLLICISVVSALPPTHRPTTSLYLTITNATNPRFPTNLTQSLKYFPPGPPTANFFHPLPTSELGMTFSPLGLIPNRNEALVRRAIMSGILTSLDKRVSAKMSGHGYQLQEGNVVIGVNHAVGRSELTWGMWTMVLNGMNEYVVAYPGWDFMFEVRLMEGESMMGFEIGAGFCITRQRGVVGE